MTARRLNTRPLQSRAQRDETRGRAFAYARGLLANNLEALIGSPPFSRLDAQTIAQWAWQAGYEAALYDMRRGKRTP